MLFIGRHADSLQRLVHAPADFLRRNAEILGCKRHVLFHDVRDDLVIGVLEHHAHLLADGKEVLFLLRVEPVDRHRAALGQQNCV